MEKIKYLVGLNSSGQVISETKYKAWGEVRFTSNPSPTNYTYTGQYSYTADFGLMFYNARWYDPSLGRFAQADTMVPGGVQGLDRYAYVNNSPMNFVDPSGHEPGNHCDRGYCDADGNVIMANPLMGCGTTCALEVIEEASLDERLEWLNSMQNDMNETIGQGAGDWFINIATVVTGFNVVGQGNNEWAMNVDAVILYELQEGYNGYLNNNRENLTNGGEEWYDFFELLSNPGSSTKDLISQWGVAEFTATNDALLKHGISLSGDDFNFLIIGSVYRGVQGTACSLLDCSSSLYGFFDPRASFSDVFGTTFGGPYNNMSPVAAALGPIYAGRYIGTEISRNR
ncbi:MAG: RHS repeat-associated core domain-containing protein [Anaerolineae bacterium]|nr:RHS repeat-associated core domain-containing protein [Anaerolineae bacterium]